MQLICSLGKSERAWAARCPALPVQVQQLCCACAPGEVVPIQGILHCCASLKKDGVTVGSVLSASNAVQTCSAANDTLDDGSDRHRARAAVFRLFFLFTAFLLQYTSIHSGWCPDPEQCLLLSYPPVLQLRTTYTVSRSNLSTLLYSTLVLPTYSRWQEHTGVNS